MQLDALVLYNAQGKVRTIRFRPGRLNIISGESGTGKSSMIGIIRFLLGGKSPEVPLGPIQDTVKWYGLLAHAGNTSFFIGRPACPHGTKTTHGFISIGATEAPPLSELTHNTNSEDIIATISGFTGIKENLHDPAPGQTRPPLAANLRHAIYYCFQGQGEIANPDHLFHRQNRDFQKQAIRDTLPYFLGAQDPDALRKRQKLTEVKRELRRSKLRLKEAEEMREDGAGLAARLITEAQNNGLLSSTDAPTSANQAFSLLSGVLNTEEPPLDVDDLNGTNEIERLLEQRAELRAKLRDLSDKINALDDFAQVGSEYNSELNEHRVRLQSIALIPDKTVPATCPVCTKPIADPSAYEAVNKSLGRISHRIKLSQRNTPHIDEARSALASERSRVRSQITEISTTLSNLVRHEDIHERTQLTWQQQSFCRGRIAQFIETAKIDDDDTLEALSRKVDELKVQEEQLTDDLDLDRLRAETNSRLSVVGHRMTELARSFPLEHSQHGVRIDPYRLTVVADTPQGPAYMDAGAIGSGMSWVGYHLAAYLALQRYFIETDRPVPRFMILDQPSQAFFPRDRDTGGDMAELSDADRSNTLKLYEMMHETIAKQKGKLQIIVLDHADFPDSWFKDSVIENWRNGTALIPQEWLHDDNLNRHP